MENSAPEAAAEAIFDRPHLARYTMDNPELEKEIIGLFLQQLPSIITMLAEAESAAAWKMAAHTLKGSAAAVGATAIHACAVDLEARGYVVDVDVKIKLIADLQSRAARFDAMIGGLYG
jgi:HPt (histidine-containing phosphotransfer) domain-containing protein